MVARRATVVLALLLLAALVGGCAQSSGPTGAPPPAPASPTRAASAAPTNAPAPAPTAAPAAAQPKQELLFSIPSRNVNYIVPMTAVARGFFDEAGLDVKIEAIAPNLTVAAMQRGDVKLTGTGGSVIRSAVRSGGPFTVIAFMTQRPNYYVLTTPDIQTPAQLVGRRIGVASLGDTPQLFTEIWLRARGVDPGEVLFTGLGPNPTVHLSALDAGALDGAVFDPASTAVAEARGLRLLQALGEVAAAPQQGIVATHDLLQNSPDVVRAFLKGLVRGLRYAKANVRDVAAVARQELGHEMDEATAMRAVQLYVDGISAEAPGYADERLLEAFYYYDVRLPLELPPDQPIPPHHDFRYLLEVYDQLGIPRPR